MKHLSEPVITHMTARRPGRVSITVGGKDIFLSSESGLPADVNRYSVTQVRESPGYPINRFRKLAGCIAELGFHNQHLNLLFRGQQKDYLDKKKRSRIYPTFYRAETPNGRVVKALLQTRSDKLDEYVRKIRRKRARISYHKGLSGYREYYYSLIQHYEVFPAPLIDLTQSLRVAATFALRSGDEGFVYAFGFPHPQGSISHMIDEEITLVKLQNVCPHTALRPHYQEGFLAGRLPIVLTRKEAGDNIARRLVGKYKLDNSDGQFWDKGFDPIPEEALFPPKDPFFDLLSAILEL